METFSALPVLALITGEFPSQLKASDTERWCFLWYAPERKVEQTFHSPVIWDAIALIMTSL